METNIPKSASGSQVVAKSNQLLVFKTQPKPLFLGEIIISPADDLKNFIFTKKWESK